MNMADELHMGIGILIMYMYRVLCLACVDARYESNIPMACAPRLDKKVTCRTSQASVCVAVGANTLHMD